MNDAAQSRPNHYDFAHRFLPELFFHDPLRFIAASSLGGVDFASQLWEACDDSGPSEPGAPSTEGLQVISVDRGPVIGNVYVLPAPLAVPEAHMIFAFVVVEAGAFGAVELREQHYFTLEKAHSPAGARTCLCAWTKDPAHLNLGRGCEPDVDAFIAQCIGTLDRCIS